MLLDGLLRQSLAKWPIFPQLKQGPLGHGHWQLDCPWTLVVLLYSGWAMFVYALLPWYWHRLYRVLVLDKSIGTWTLLYAGRGALVELYCGLCCRCCCCWGLCWFCWGRPPQVRGLNWFWFCPNVLLNPLGLGIPRLARMSLIICRPLVMLTALALYSL
jgi:hypothetical protein